MIKNVICGQEYIKSKHSGLYNAIGNAIERKLDPVNGWDNQSQHDYWVAMDLLREGTVSWSPPGLADDEDGIYKIEAYVYSFTVPAFDQLEQQAVRIIEIPEIWQQVFALAAVLMTVERLDGKEVTQILEAQS